jgi:hypothetical protein
MPKYKNNSNRAIHGIEPGQTGDLDDATGLVGPDALEEVSGAVGERTTPDYEQKRKPRSDYDLPGDE